MDHRSEELNTLENYYSKYKNVYKSVCKRSKNILNVKMIVKCVNKISEIPIYHIWFLEPMFP